MNYVIIYNQKITLPRNRPYKDVFQFKLTLRDIDPPIWRQIVVPGSYTFYDFHVAIQNAMGWFDCHLHGFNIEDKSSKLGVMEIEGPWTEKLEPKDDWEISTEIPLDKHFKQKGDRALYCYDYGDNWEMDIELEGIFPKKVGQNYTICLEGDRSGPPEDCGSTPGYMRCIDAVKNNDDSDGLLTWLDGWRLDDFDPNTKEDFIYGKAVANVAGRTVYASVGSIAAANTATVLQHIRVIERGSVQRPMKRFSP